MRGAGRLTSGLAARHADGMADEHEQEYDAAFVELLESVWGEGFLSPGGPEEVGRILVGVDLQGATVLDIGCGTGGATFLMANLLKAGDVVGIDVSAAVIEEAEARSRKHPAERRPRFRLVEPGPLPFPDDEFDVVFSK